MATPTPYSPRLRRAAAHLWQSIRTRFFAAAERAGRDAESRRRVRARARFWAEFRRGQGEAETHARTRG
jgi:hypothetical protein